MSYVGKGSPYSITERWVPELIPVLGSQPAGDASHKPVGRLSLLPVRPAVTPATLNSFSAPQIPELYLRGATSKMREGKRRQGEGMGQAQFSAKNRL